MSTLDRIADRPTSRADVMKVAGPVWLVIDQ